MRRTGPAVALLAAALLAAGCGAPATDDRPHGGTDAHVHEEFESAPASPSWDAQSAADAEQVAYDAMTAYVSPPEGWWDRVEPYLTPESASLYAIVRPEEIEVDRVLVSSPAQLTATMQDVPYFATVPVRTDVGVVTVKLARTGAGQPWLVQEFDLPAKGGA